MIPSIPAIGLVGRSSLSYVQTVFQLYKERQAFVPITSRAAGEALRAITISQFLEPAQDSGWFVERHEPVCTNELAQVNFTSGTTGTPKGILLTHANLADTTHRLIEAMALDASIREYVGVPPTYSFGLGRLRACSAVGGQAFIPPKGFDLAEFAHMLEVGEVNALSAVPTLLRVLLNRTDRFADIRGNLKWLEIGSQEMSADEKRRLRDLFPNARIVQHYGLTEASRTTFLNVSRDPLHALSSVGSPLGQTEVALSPESRIRIRGPHVASEWIDENGRHPLTDEEGWLTTNDLGHFVEGRLIFEGRADDLINCSGIKISPELAEARLRDRLGVAGGVAVARVPDPLRGDGVLVAVEHGIASENDLRTAAFAVLESFGLSASSALHVWQLDCLPVTATGKLQRSKLSQLFADEVRDQAQHTAHIGQDTADTSVRAAFRAAFPGRTIQSSDTFLELGGDSLAFVTISAALDGNPKALPRDWHELPVGELEKTFGAPASRAMFWSIRPVSTEIVLRAIAVTMIVSYHVLEVRGAGVEILLLLYGLSLARVQLPILTSPKRWNLFFDLFGKLLLPYYVIVLAVWINRPSGIALPDVLLFRNFIGGADFTVLAYWFIQAYTQCILLLILAASIPFASRLIRERPDLAGLILLAGSLLAKPLSPLVFDDPRANSWTPDQFFYLIALGWCIEKLRTRPLKLALALTGVIIGVFGYLQFYWWQSDGMYRGPLTAAAIMILIYIPVVSLPNFLRHAAIEVSIASITIYLSHWLLFTHFEAVVSEYLAIPLLLLAGIMINVARSRIVALWKRPRAL
jgi:acyl-CoA synthetase (AMP-forming)/AMP-acid ligase II